MAHTKAGGSTRQKGNRRGKHLGVRVYSGQVVQPGHIIVRQKGSLFHSASGVKMGRDFTLYSVRAGLVKFFRRAGQQLVAVSAVEP